MREKSLDCLANLRLIKKSVDCAELRLSHFSTFKKCFDAKQTKIKTCNLFLRSFFKTRSDKKIVVMNS